MAEEKPIKKISEKKLAIILVRGLIGMRKDARFTVELLKLFKKNTCVVVDDNKVMRGMANKIKDFSTYGELDDKTHKLLLEKRAKTKKGVITNVFHLNPPRKGFERNGIKQPFTKKGALGYRKEKINDLIQRMV